MKFLKLFSLLSLLSFGLSASAFDILPKDIQTNSANPTTPEKIALGKQLYFDKRLSLDNSVSCNSCHNVLPGGNGVDGKSFSSGVKGQLGGRNSPTVYNAAFMSVQFWDGRAASLEDQAKGPVLNPVEMAMASADAVVERISKIGGYTLQFKKIFGEQNSVTYDHIAMAIAAFERTLITPNSPVDRFIAGDKKALGKSAQNGMKLVQTTGCAACHNGPNYAGPALAVGTGFYMKFPTIPGSEYDAKYQLSKDFGRFEATKQEGDKNMWRVATWRNVARTAPYFHNGSVKTLDEAVLVMAKTQLGKTLTPNEVKDIVAFLTGLNGELPKVTEPTLP